MSQRTCRWCGVSQTDPLTITVTGEDVSPPLCHECTDQWDEGTRKFREIVQTVLAGNGGTMGAVADGLKAMGLGRAR